MNPFAEDSTALTKVWICSYLPQWAKNVALVQKPANNILRGGVPWRMPKWKKTKVQTVQRCSKESHFHLWRLGTTMNSPDTQRIVGWWDKTRGHLTPGLRNLIEENPASVFTLEAATRWNHGITHKLIQMTPRNLEPVQQSNTTSYLALPLQTMPQPERDFASTSKWLSQGIGKGWHRIRCSQIRWAICLDMGADKHPTCKSWNAFEKNGNVSLELIRVQSWAPLSQWLLELLISSYQIWIHMFEIPQRLWMDPNLSSRKCFQVSYVFDKNSSFKYTRYAPGQVWQVTLPWGNLV